MLGPSREKHSQPEGSQGRGFRPVTVSAGCCCPTLCDNQPSILWLSIRRAHPPAHVSAGRLRLTGLTGHQLSSLLSAPVWLPLVQAAGGVRVCSVFAHFLWTTGYLGSVFSQWVTGMQEGKGKYGGLLGPWLEISTQLPSAKYLWSGGNTPHLLWWEDLRGHRQPAWRQGGRLEK